MRYKKGCTIGTAKIIGCRDPVCSADVEPTAGRSSVEAKENPRFHSRVRITVISYRSRLCDVDGTSVKAAIDGLVHCGVLVDDSPEFVEEVRFRQVKVKSKEEEETRLIIEAIE